MDPDRRQARKIFKSVTKSFGIPKSHFKPGKAQDLGSTISQAMRGPIQGKERTLRKGKPKPSASEWAGWD